MLISIIVFLQYVEFNESITCGVSPATNDYLYKYNYHDEDYAGSKYNQYGTALSAKDDTAPNGKYPWDVRITDDYEVSRALSFDIMFWFIANDS